MSIASSIRTTAVSKHNFFVLSNIFMNTPPLRLILTSNLPKEKVKNIKLEEISSYFFLRFGKWKLVNFQTRNGAYQSKLVPRMFFLLKEPHSINFQNFLFVVTSVLYILLHPVLAAHTSFLAVSPSNRESPVQTWDTSF